MATSPTASVHGEFGRRYVDRGRSFRAGGPDLREGRPADGRKRPAGVVSLGLSGAALIALQSTWAVLFGGLAESPQGPGWGLSIQVLGGLGLAEAVGLALASLFAYTLVRSHTTLGIVMISLSLLSLYSGGGLILGTLLGYVGGLLAIAYRPVGETVDIMNVNLDEVRDDPVAEAELVDAGILPVGSTGTKDRGSTASRGG